MAVALLVPSPLLGPPSLEPLAASLERAGLSGDVVHLTPPVDAVHPWWASAATEVASAARRAGDDVILVGHSGAGPRLPAFAEAVVADGGHPAGYVFVDAGLPTRGRSPADTAPPDLLAQLDRLTDDDGMLPPWCEWWGEGMLAALVPDPVARHHLEAACWPVPRSLFDEVAPVSARWPDAPCAYLRCSEAYDADAAAAEQLGWLVVRRDGTHLDPLTAPDDVAVGIIHAAAALSISMR